MRNRQNKTQREPTIALINVVFLMLIFFLVAGTIAPSLEKDLKLVSTADIDGTAPADALVVHADGRMSHRGTEIPSVAAFLSGQPKEASARVRVIPDKDLSAARLIAIGRSLRQAGADKIVLVTERGLQ